VLLARILANARHRPNSWTYYIWIHFAGTLLRMRSGASIRCHDVRSGNIAFRCKLHIIGSITVSQRKLSRTSSVCTQYEENPSEETRRRLDSGKVRKDLSHAARLITMATALLQATHWRGASRTNKQSTETVETSQQLRSPLPRRSELGRRPNSSKVKNTYSTTLTQLVKLSASLHLPSARHTLLALLCLGKERARYLAARDNSTSNMFKRGGPV